VSTGLAHLQPTHLIQARRRPLRAHLQAGHPDSTPLTGPLDQAWWAPPWAPPWLSPFLEFILAPAAQGTQHIAPSSARPGMLLGVPCLGFNRQGARIPSARLATTSQLRQRPTGYPTSVVAPRLVPHQQG
jgi:hypothetical protein